MLTVQLQYIPEQNMSIGCAVKTLNWSINILSESFLRGQVKTTVIKNKFGFLKSMGHHNPYKFKDFFKLPNLKVISTWILPIIV